MNCLSLLISLSLFAGGNTGKAGTEACIAEEESDSIRVSSSELAARIIDEARKYIGKPYRSGGKGPNSFDCSGFTSYIYGRFGFRLSPSSSMQAQEGRPVEGSISNLQKGDIIVFGARRNSRRVGHVGIYIGPDKSGDGFTFIHAAVHGGIKISNSDEDYYRERFLGARRFLPDFFDSLDGTGDFPEGCVVEMRDTLILGEKDLRIILLDNGTWGYLTPEGGLMKTSSEEKILLDTNGRWAAIPLSRHTIPSLKNIPQNEEAPAPPPETVTTSAQNQESVQKSSAPAQNPAAPASSGGKQYHTIKKGDTLTSIASKYHTTVKDLCSLNGISSAKVLQIGKKLRVK